LKADFQLKLAEKDNEVTKVKEQMSKEIVAKSIDLVASQGTNIIIDSHSPATMTPDQAYKHLESLSGEAKQRFYEANKNLFLTVLKSR
jgi:predicted ATPase